MNKNKFNLKNVIAIAIFLAGLTAFVGCENKENPELGEFCLYANVESFYETAPSINAYLYSLPRNWSDEQKLNALINWLNAQPCVINAKLVSEANTFLGTPTVKSTPMQPPRGTIAIQLDKNNTEPDIFLKVGTKHPYTSDVWVATIYRYMRPREVSVLIQPVSSVNMVFDFINSFDFEVTWLTNLWFYSTAHNFNLDNLISKLPIGSVGTIPGKPIFELSFLNMHNENYQADVLKFMEDYQISLINCPWTGHINAGITFLVPAGEERVWVARFLADYEFVISARRTWGIKGMYAR